MSRSDALELILKKQCTIKMQYKSNKQIYQDTGNFVISAILKERTPSNEDAK